MKKLFILCLMLSLILTSCDLRDLIELEKTPETEANGDNAQNDEQENQPKLPCSDLVLLSNLIKRGDVAKIECVVTSFWDSTTGKHYYLSDVDEFLNLFLDANADLQFITDIPDVYDLFDEQIAILRESELSDDELIYFDLLDCNDMVLATGTIYPNGMIGMYISNMKNSYVSVSPLNTDIEDFINLFKENQQ